MSGDQRQMQADIQRLEAVMAQGFKNVHRHVGESVRTLERGQDRLEGKVDSINGGLAKAKERISANEGRLNDLARSLDTTRSNVHDLLQKVTTWLGTMGLDKAQRSLQSNVNRAKGDDATWTWRDTRWMFYLLTVGAGATLAVLKLAGKL